MLRSIAAVLTLGLLLAPLRVAALESVAHPVAVLQYPPAPKNDTVDTYFGVKVPDPYRPLENIDAPATLKWEHAEEHLTRSYLDAIPARPAIERHLKHIVDYEKIGAPWHVKNQYFYSYNSGLQNQDVLYTMNGAHGKPRVLIDPNTLSKDGTIALGATSVSMNARYIAYATQSAGSDWETWHVRNIATGKDLPDVLDWSKFSGASWMPDNRSFLYARYAQPKPGEARTSALYNQRIYLHRLGTPQSADRLFYARPDHKDWFIGTTVTLDGRYVIISTNTGTSPDNRVFYVDLHDPKRRVRPIFPTANASYTYLDNVGTRFYFQTDLHAPRGRVVAIALHSPGRLVTVIPQRAAALSSVSSAGHRFFANYLVDAHSAVRVYDYAGHFVRDVPLPGIGSASGFDGWPDDTHVYYSYASWTTPSAIYSYDIATGKSVLYRRPHIAFDADSYQTDEVFYHSKDGTRIPMMIAHRKGIVLDGTNPTILYGYGGFDIPMTPYFSTFIATWLQMGGIYAVANIRGGSEYGEAWHRAGMLANKQNVFDDFIAAAEYLKAKGYTSTAKLAIKGESNGGLLIGAVETQRPDLVGAAIPGVGVLDMLRFDKFTVGNAWIPEYGCATCSKAQFETLLRYSPLQNVRPGTHYTPTLIMTAVHDDRVFPAHSFKFAATMQADQAGDAPILLRIEAKAGHGGGTPISKSIDEYTDIYAFLVKSLHVEIPVGF